MNKALLLSNIAPYPTDNGGKIFIMSLLKCFKNLGLETDLFCFHDPCDTKTSLNELKKVSNPIVVENEIITASHPFVMKIKAFSSLFSCYSYGVYKFKNRNMFKILKKSLKKTKYDIVFLGSVVMAPYFKLIKKYQPRAKIVLCEQNCENLIMRRRFKNADNFFLKLFLKIEVNKLTSIEKKMLSTVDLNFILSKEDVSALENSCNCKFNYKIIPIAMDQLPLKKQNFNFVKKKKLLFIGTLSWEPNNDGLIWFMKYVFPFLSGDIEFDIIGKGASNDLKDEVAKFPNAHLIGYVNNLDSYFDGSDLLIVPLFIGSGQRVKIIEAFSRAMPVVSTTIGAEGLITKNKENILIADTANDFIHIIESYSKDELCVIGKNGKKTFDSNYSIFAISMKIKDALNKL